MKTTATNAPIKILADGTQLEPGSDRTDHVAVFFPADGVMFYVKSLAGEDGRSVDQPTCKQLCADLRVLGYDDWSLASIKDWERFVIDRSRHRPALDTSIFPGIKSSWHWTCTWRVSADNGNVLSFHRNYGGYALAVRRVC